MKLSEVKALLLKQLEPFAVSHGFKMIKKDFALRKVYDNRTVTIDFSYNYWQDEIHLFPYVKIEFNDIHRICEDNGFHLNYTAFLNLFVLQKIVNGEWTEDTCWQMQYKNPLYDKLQALYTNIVNEADFLPETKAAFEQIKLYLGNKD